MGSAAGSHGPQPVRRLTRRARRIRIAALLGVFATGAHLTGAPVTADPLPVELRLVRITVDELEVERVDTVLVLKFGEFDTAPVTPAQSLGVGDEIRCSDARVAVRMAGPDGQPQVSMRGPFRVALAPPREGDGAPLINLLGGEVHVQSDQQSAVQAGEVRIGSRATTYGVRLERQGLVPSVETLVFDGGVEVEAAERRYPVYARGQASMLRLDVSGGTEVATVPEAAVQSTARLYAALDIDAARIKEKGVDGKQAVAQLAAGYAQVFANPQNGRVRYELAEQKVRYESPDGLAYQLDRVVADRRTDPDLYFDKAVLQIALGDTKAVDADSVRAYWLAAKRMGPTRLDGLLPEDGAARVDRWLQSRDSESQVKDLLTQRRYPDARALADRLEGKGRATLYLSLLKAAFEYHDADGARRFGLLAMQRDVAGRELNAQQEHGLWDLWRAGNREGPLWAPPESWAFRLLQVGLADDAVVTFRWLARRVQGTSRTLYGLALAQSKSRDPRETEGARATVRRALELAQRDHGLSAGEVAQAVRILGAR